MIGLILAVETFTGRNWLDFSDPASLSWQYSMRAARQATSGCAVLCLGDSLVKHGLAPSVMEATSACRTLNLAAARCPTPMTYFLLRRALDSGAQPRAIVFDVKPAVLIGGLDWNLRYWQEVVSLREAIELFQWTKRGRFLTLTLAGRLLPSLRSRLELRSNLMAALRGEVDQLHQINRILWRNWSVNQGANIASSNSSYTGEVTPEVAERLHAGRFYVDRVNAEAIDRILRLAGERKIPAFWLLPPLSPALQSLRDQSGAEAAYEKLVMFYQSRYRHNLTVLDGRHAGYAPDFFVDATHLNGRGTVALSGAVAAVLVSELDRGGRTDTPRWINLAGPQASLADLEFPLEDLERSKAVMHSSCEK
jgi:hypothetical protein